MSTCARCGREIRVGDDCYQIARGVEGTRGFINLQHSMFCSLECLEHDPHFVEDKNGKPGIPRNRRVP